MNFTLHIWRQANPKDEGRFVPYQVRDITPDMSFLETLDALNDQIIAEGSEPPIAFDSDCREGICGACSLVIDGVPHGPRRAATACQLYMRNFADGSTITVEPFRARAFPIIQDLVVDRRALDYILQAGGFVSVNTGAAPDAHTQLIPRDQAHTAFDAATCIGCGACVAACPNASAMLFVAAKVTHLSLLPQGQPERERRVIRMVEEMDRAGFGNCSNNYECAAVCPKQIPLAFIARMNREFLGAALPSREFTRPRAHIWHEE